MARHSFPAPRSFLETPNDFGRSERPVWRNTEEKPKRRETEEEEAEREKRNAKALRLRGAAIHQHRVALQIRKLLAERPAGSKSVASLAEQANVDRDTINSVLAGRTHASIALLAIIADVLGADLTVEIS